MVLLNDDLVEEIVVRVCIQLEDGTRKQKMSSGDVSLWQLMQELLYVDIVRLLLLAFFFSFPCHVLRSLHFIRLDQGFSIDVLCIPEIQQSSNE